MATDDDKIGEEEVRDEVKEGGCAAAVDEYNDDDDDDADDDDEEEEAEAEAEEEEEVTAKEEERTNDDDDEGTVDDARGDGGRGCRCDTVAPPCSCCSGRGRETEGGRGGARGRG